ncbi:Tryptophan hydroxylase [Paragonimus heterotremus]|uniref:Tryptophan hydroxylase n=1 Tax=Paragonimus heterotremus TaxID=100268 RepID=A0A8J4T920_9TREM|nr:Tryptophan hydroxylase [Paragonimus heterotremus]
MNAELSHLETRQNLDKNNADKIDHNLELFARTSIEEERMEDLTKALQKVTTHVAIYTEEPSGLSEKLTPPGEGGLTHVPWFPRHVSELDEVSNHVLMYGKDLDADHPGFKDEEYRKRRIIFADIAFNYKYGQPIPRIEYTETEKNTWRTIYKELVKLYETHACTQHLENLKLLQQHAGYRESDIPQLEDVSKFLKARTGFTVRPVAGYISARDFLSGLAFRVFYCTQYIRHPKDPMYTPEPDCCHELLGHVPMLADPKFARFSHEIGLASLGVNDEEVKKLATCYFFTIEFGLCRQNGQLRAYGAGLLSSISELKYALSDKAVIKPFVPTEVMKEECMVTTFQKGYFETSTFEEATEKMRHFAKTIKRPFDVVYDPYTETIRPVDSLTALHNVLSDLNNNLSLIVQSLDRMNRNTAIGGGAQWIMDERDESAWNRK